MRGDDCHLRQSGQSRLLEQRLNEGVREPCECGQKSGPGGRTSSAEAPGAGLPLARQTTGPRRVTRVGSAQVVPHSDILQSLLGCKWNNPRGQNSRSVRLKLLGKTDRYSPSSECSCLGFDINNDVAS